MLGDLLFGVLDLLADQTHVLLAAVALKVLAIAIAPVPPLASRTVHELQPLVLLLLVTKYLVGHHGSFVAEGIAIVRFGAQEAGVGAAAGAEHHVVLAGALEDVLARWRRAVDEAAPVLQQVLILEVAEEGLELDGREQDEDVGQGDGGRALEAGQFLASLLLLHVVTKAFEAEQMRAVEKSEFILYLRCA
jgi:hypothetical protein